MIKLNKQIDSLENAIEKIEQKIENLIEKRNAIEVALEYLRHYYAE